MDIIIINKKEKDVKIQLGDIIHDTRNNVLYLIKSKRDYNGISKLTTYYFLDPVNSTGLDDNKYDSLNDIYDKFVNELHYIYYPQNEYKLQLVKKS